MTVDPHELLRRLSAPFPEQAIERTRASENGKGYPTTGVRVQFIINRLNEVLGVGGFRVDRSFTTRERTTRQGATVFEVICDLRLQLGQWENGSFVPFCETEATGGHVAPFEADARKGAHSNALKKAAAAVGVGWQFYAGVADDDNQPVPPGAVDLPPATDAQRAALARLVAIIGANAQDYAAYVERTRGLAMDQLDRRTASELIGELRAKARSRARRTA